MTLSVGHGIRARAAGPRRARKMSSELSSQHGSRQEQNAPDERRRDAAIRDELEMSAGLALKEQPDDVDSSAHAGSALRCLIGLRLQPDDQHGGRLEQARKTVARMRELDPTLRVSSLKHWLPFRLPEHLGAVEAGLYNAGLPD